MPTDGQHRDAENAGWRLPPGRTFESARTFAIELFKNPISRLLIRSPNTSAHPSRIDLAFLNVEYISVSTIFYGLKVSSVEAGVAEDVETLERAHTRRFNGSPTVVYRLDSFPDGKTVSGYVIASSLWLAEDELTNDKPSALIIN